MAALLTALIVTNLVTLGMLARLLLRPDPHPPLEEQLAVALTDARPPGATRRVITVEILNPIELAGSRSRWAGLVGAVAPGLTRRVVHDVILKSLRRQLADQQVIADVRVHVIERATAGPVDLVKPQGAQPG